MAKSTARSGNTDAKEARGLIEWAIKQGVTLAHVTVGTVSIAVAEMPVELKAAAPAGRRPAPMPRGHHRQARTSTAGMSDRDAATSLYRTMGGDAFAELERAGMLPSDAPDDDDDDEPSVGADG